MAAAVVLVFIHVEAVLRSRQSARLARFGRVHGADQTWPRDFVPVNNDNEYFFQEHSRAAGPYMERKAFLKGSTKKNYGIVWGRAQGGV